MRSQTPSIHCNDRERERERDCIQLAFKGETTRDLVATVWTAVPSHVHMQDNNYHSIFLFCRPVYTHKSLDIKI